MSLSVYAHYVNMTDGKQLAWHAQCLLSVFPAVSGSLLS